MSDVPPLSRQKHHRADANLRRGEGAAANLAPAPGSNLQTHLANLKATTQPAPATALASVHDARDYVKRQAGNYFQSH